MPGSFVLSTCFWKKSVAYSFAFTFDFASCNAFSFAREGCTERADGTSYQAALNKIKFPSLTSPLIVPYSTFIPLKYCWNSITSILAGTEVCFVNSNLSVPCLTEKYSFSNEVAASFEYGLASLLNVISEGVCFSSEILTEATFESLNIFFRWASFCSVVFCARVERLMIIKTCSISMLLNSRINFIEKFFSLINRAYTSMGRKGSFKGS